MNGILTGKIKIRGPAAFFLFRAALVLLLWALVWPGPVRAGGGGIVVTVDGASFTNILLPSDPDLPGHYLKQALGEIIREYGIDEIEQKDLTSLSWYPQDPLIASTTAIKDLAAILARESKRARAEGKKFIVAAHSWGTFLANAALGYATNKPVEGGLEFEQMVPPDLWIALGSPLGHRQVLFNPTEIFLAAYVDYVKHLVREELGPVPVPQGIGRIVDYWAWGDIISGPLASTAWLEGLEVEDHPVDLELEGYDRILLRRNSANTVGWHYYDSLMSGGLKDNSKLRQAVAGLISQVLEE